MPNEVYMLDSCHCCGFESFLIDDEYGGRRRYILIAMAETLNVTTHTYLFI